MSVKVTAAVVAAASGTEVNVSSVCRGEGVSRKTFYKWVARYRADGLAGLEDRSRRPLRSPGQTPAEIEDVIVTLRKELSDAGLDHGATTIQWHLGRHHDLVGRRVPSVASVHRILVRRGLVTAQPRKRPKSSWRRFEAAAPNERWQIDAMDWTIATGVVRVFNIIDDHSRVDIVSRAVAEATAEEAWATLCIGAQRWGLPTGVLSDNGLCFSGRIRGFEVLFEANLRDAGVRPSTGAPFHPQTTGKVERFQQTLKNWLRSQPLAANIGELQAQLDQFTDTYNHHRPHQGIGRVTPISRWQASPAAGPATQPLTHPDYTSKRVDTTISASGVAFAKPFAIHIGVEWAGQDATVLLNGHTAAVLVNNNLARHLTLDLDRRYQPSGRPAGRRPRTHVLS